MAAQNLHRFEADFLTARRARQLSPRSKVNAVRGLHRVLQLKFFIENALIFKPFLRGGRGISLAPIPFA